MKTSAVLALATLTAAILLLAIFDPLESRDTQGSLRVVDSRLSGTANYLRIDLGDMTLEAVGGDGAWRLREPDEGAANGRAVADLLAAIELLDIKRRAHAESIHGLAAPRASLVVGFPGGERQHLRLGAESGDPRYTWVSVVADEALLVETHLVDEILREARRLPSLRLLPWRVDREQPLSLEWAGQTIRIDDGRVSFSKTAGGLDAESHQILLSSLQALSFQDAQALSCDSKGRVLSITHQEHSTAIEECGLCGDELIGLRSGGRTGCVSQADWESIVGLVSEPRRLLDVALLPTRIPKSDFSIRCDDEMIRIKHLEVDHRALTQWWQAIDRGAQGLEDPAAESHERCTIDLEESELKIVVSGTTSYAQRSGESAWWRVSEAAARLLRADALLFTSRTLIREEPILARSFQLRERNQAMRLHRGVLADGWNSDDDAMESATVAARARLWAETIAHLRVESFSTDTPTGKALRTIEATFESALGEDSIYRISIFRGGAWCLLQVDDGPVGPGDEQTCATLLL